MSYVHHLLSRIPDDLPDYVEELVTASHSLFCKFPPEKLAGAAERYLKERWVRSNGRFIILRGGMLFILSLKSIQNTHYSLCFSNHRNWRQICWDYFWDTVSFGGQKIYTSSPTSTQDHSKLAGWYLYSSTCSLISGTTLRRGWGELRRHFHF